MLFTYISTAQNLFLVSATCSQNISTSLKESVSSQVLLYTSDSKCRCELRIVVRRNEVTVSNLYTKYNLNLQDSNLKIQWVE